MKIPRFFWSQVVLLCAASVGLRAAEAPESASPKNGYTVTVQAKISEAGVPEEVKVVGSDEKTPDDVLKKMALALALKTKMPPREKNGVAVRYTARMPFFFPIEGDEGPAAEALPIPRVKNVVQPAYPLELREKGVVGGAILELLIDAEGKLTSVTTLRASHPEFEAAATDSVKKWEFAPAQKDGKPVESRSRLAIVFETVDSMADLKWRIPPRPSLATFTVIRPNHPLEDPDKAAPAAEAPPAATPEATGK